MTDSNPLYDSIINGDAPGAATAAQASLASGKDPLAIVQDDMMAAMAEVGRLFEAGDYFVPDLLMAGRAMKAALEFVQPRLTESGTPSSGRVVIGTVAGDLHDIGKNLVIAMLEGGGFEVTDLGTDVAPTQFVEAITRQGAQLVCLSALLTVTLPAMRATIDAIGQAGLRDRVKIMVGGAPVTAQFAQDIGADGYGETAAAAVGLATRLLSGPAPA